MTESSSPIKLLIADDHPIVMQGIEALFRGTEFEVVASCRNGEEVLESVASTKPDIMILDIQMPKLTGLAAMRGLRTSGNTIPIILLTASLTDAEALEAIQLGVEGLVLKETAPRQLLQCARSVMAGEHWLDPEATQRALQQAIVERRNPDPSSGALTPREADLARLVSRGLRNKEIAAEMKITEGTVKMHLHHIYEKLGLGSRTELALFVHDHDLG